jgi:hypothetical protein
MFVDSVTFYFYYGGAMLFDNMIDGMQDAKD